MEEIKAVWSGRVLITVWKLEDGRYWVTVLDANCMAYLQGWERSFASAIEASDYVDKIVAGLDRVLA